MSALCLGAVAIAMAPQFTLSWTHSVERVTWRETWAVEDNALRLVEGAVQGSGAGMEPGEGARLKDGWWVWEGRVIVPALVLAASGATVSGWTLCAGGSCRVLGTEGAEPLRLAPCAAHAGSSAAATAVAE